MWRRNAASGTIPGRGWGGFAATTHYDASIALSRSHSGRGQQRHTIATTSAHDTHSPQPCIHTLGYCDIVSRSTTYRHVRPRRRATASTTMRFSVASFALASCSLLTSVSAQAAAAGLAIPQTLVGTWSTKSNKTLTGPVRARFRVYGSVRKD